MCPGVLQWFDLKIKPLDIDGTRFQEVVGSQMMSSLRSFCNCHKPYELVKNSENSFQEFMHHNFHPLQASSTRSRTLATVRMIVLCYLCNMLLHHYHPLPAPAHGEHRNIHANARAAGPLNLEHVQIHTNTMFVCACRISLYSYINSLAYPFLSQAVCYHRFFSSYHANLRCAWSFGRRIRLQKYWPRCTRHEAGHVDLSLCRKDWKPLVASRVAICRDLRPTFFPHFSTFLKLHLIASHFRRCLQGDIETAARLLARAKSLRVFPLLRKHLPQGWMMDVAEVNCWLGYSWMSLISVHVHESEAMVQWCLVNKAF